MKRNDKRDEKVKMLKKLLAKPRTRMDLQMLSKLPARSVGRYLLSIGKEQPLYKKTDGKSKQIFYSLVEIPGGDDRPTAIFGTASPDKAIVKDEDTGVSLTADEASCKKLLKKKGCTIGELSRGINAPRGISKEYVYTLLQALQDKGFAVAVDPARKEAVLNRSEIETDTRPLELEPLYRHRIRFGLIGDTQFGSRYQQIRLVHTAYDIFDEEKVDFVIHLGDLVDGIKMYRGQDQEIFLHGADDQLEYTVNNYPERKYKTYIIAGNHDLVYKKLAGYNIVEQICAKRPDLVYKGEVGAHTFKVKKLTFDVLHPTGGVPYAKSYRIQKVIEGALGDIINRLRTAKDLSIIPHFLIMGHLHVMNYTPHIGVEGYMVPCLQSQTPYLKAKGLQPELGVLILDVSCDRHWNITKVLLDHRKFNAYVRENDF